MLSPHHNRGRQARYGRGIGSSALSFGPILTAEFHKLAQLAKRSEELCGAALADAFRDPLAGRVQGMDDRDYPLEGECVERPVDRRARRLLGESLAASVRHEPPGNLESRPALRRQRPDPAEKGAGG